MFHDLNVSDKCPAILSLHLVYYLKIKARFMKIDISNTDDDNHNAT